LPVKTRRTQQYCGKTGEASDLVGIPGVHIESKRCEKLSLYEAMAQAKRDSKDQDVPTVFHRRSHKPWLVIVELDRLVELSELIVNAKEQGNAQRSAEGFSSDPTEDGASDTDAIT